MIQKFQTIGVLSSIALVVGSIFGTGIFVTPSYVARFTASVPLTILLWAVGALLCMIGGNIYGRLGERFPQAGGPYVYLREAFGSAASLSYGWMSFLVISPTMIASYSMFFGEQLSLLLPTLSTFDIKVAALCFAGIMTLVNGLGIQPTSAFERVIVSLQCGLILLLFLVLKNRGLEPHEIKTEIVPTDFSVSLLASALAGILWSFEGFTCLSFVAHEVKDASRRLRQSIFWGVLVVFIIYMMVNAMALTFLDRTALAATENSGALLASLAFGSHGRLFTAVVMLVAVTMSCLPATLIGPRVTYEMAQEKYLPPLFSRLSGRGRAPIGGLGVQFLLTSVFILIGNFEWLISSFITVTWIFYMIMGLAFFKIFVMPIKKRASYFMGVLQVFIFSGLAWIVVALQFWRDFQFSIVGVSLTLLLLAIAHVKIKWKRNDRAW